MPLTRLSSPMSSSLVPQPTRYAPSTSHCRSQCANNRYIKAAKAYENHVAENGQPDSHAKAKEILYVVWIQTSCCK